MMAKLTGGPGWALGSDEEKPQRKPENTGSPKPKIRVEKRAGKKVTVIAGLHTYGSDRLNEIAKKLKVMCGAGGTVKNGTIEIQGDKLAQIQEWFKKGCDAGQ